ncbi:MAG TPA: hypothetical protein VKS78_02740 [Roseiarcus sp.]|nr:hypothetical protein [Roseiarcus sp.]
MVWTKEKLCALPAKDLRSLYDNACKSEKPEAQALITLIEEIGVPALSTSMKLDSPVGKKMSNVIFSQEGRSAALKAAVDGRPPMEGIDPLLQKALGKDYNPANEATVQAGYLVANLMRQCSWETNGRRAPLPPGCVAKTAALFVHIPSKKQC